ncbi:MAG: accessory gene regulator B family protein [Lachnospiraceae bacterium]|nr:accessory gene regulator B family protein [Lachnospiraceae bacterium]
MIADFSEKLSSKMVDKGIASKEDVDLYRYGIENGIILAGNFLSSVVLGIVTGRLGMVLIFLLFCVTLRSYSGGIHSKSKLTCFILSLLILLIPVYSYSWFFKVVKEPWILTIGIVSFLIIWMLSPVESKNKPLDETEQRVYKKVSRWIVSIQSGILMVLFLLDLKDYFYAGYSSIILISVFMIMGKIHGKSLSNRK